MKGSNTVKIATVRLLASTVYRSLKQQRPYSRNKTIGYKLLSDSPSGLD